MASSKRLGLGYYKKVIVYYGYMMWGKMVNMTIFNSLDEYILYRARCYLRQEMREF